MGIPRRQAQRIGRHFQLQFEIATVGRRNDRLQAFLFFCQRIKVRVRLSVSGVYLVQFGTRFKGLAEPALDFLSDGHVGIQFGFLRQVADFQIRHRYGFALDVLVETSHDFQ